MKGLTFSGQVILSIRVKRQFASYFIFAARMFKLHTLGTLDIIKISGASFVVPR